MLSQSGSKKISLSIDKMSKHHSAPEKDCARSSQFGRRLSVTTRQKGDSLKELTRFSNLEDDFSFLNMITPNCESRKKGGSSRIHPSESIFDKTEVGMIRKEALKLLLRSETSGTRKNDATACKIIDASGGEIDLPNVSLRVPASSPKEPVSITVTQKYQDKTRKELIKLAGLSHVLEAVVHLRLQPHGQQFLKPVNLLVKNVKLSGEESMLVYHKEFDDKRETLWTDFTKRCSPEATEDGVVLSVDQFSFIEVIKVLTTTVATGFAAHVCALLNSQHSPCNFYLYYKEPDPFIVVLVETQNPDHTHSSQKFADAGYTPVGYGSSKYSLTDRENLLFSYGLQMQPAGVFPLELEKCASVGLQLQVPISVRRIDELPQTVYVRRRLTYDDQLICEVNTRICSQDNESLHETVLRKHRVEISRALDVRDVLPQLHQDGVISVNQEEELRSIPVRQSQACRLLDIIATKGQKGFKSLVKSLMVDYSFIASKMLSALHTGALSSEQESLFITDTLLGGKTGPEEDGSFNFDWSDHGPIWAEIKREELELKRKELILKEEELSIRRAELALKKEELTLRKKELDLHNG